MISRVRAVALYCVLVTAGPMAASCQETELRDRYLGRPRGPYRGQVIDAGTKAPLAGAVVVALWRRNRVYPFHSVSENYAVRETLTDAEGRFVLDAKDVEEGAPSRIYHPEFLIFQPEYGSFPSNYVAPLGYIGGIFERAGAVVELPRLESRDARRKNLRAFDPYGYSETPFKDLPEMMRRLNAESISVGLDPYTPGKD
jgi:hypothetical protein